MIKKSLVWFYSFTTYLLWAAIIVVAVVVLGLRWLVLPNIHLYKNDIAQAVSRAVGQRVTIGDIHAGWDGMQPYLDLRKVDLYDAQNRPALTLEHIETSLSWLSLPLGEPRLASLTIHQPRLTIRREADGELYVAGIPMSGPAKPQFPNWLLRQSQVDVVNASVVWEDALRKTPPLSLDALSLTLRNPAWESLYGGHHFGLRAQPSAGSSQPIDIRGDVTGRDVAHPEQWHGTLYAKLEGTDIAAWRTWVDFPIGIKQGLGATQLWLDFANGRASKLTADVVLSNVVTTVRADVPEISLRALSGRLGWQQTAGGQELRAERIKLVSEGLAMQNGTFRLRTRQDKGKEIAEGSLRLDEARLEQLAAFAQRLNLNEDMHQALAQATPSGQLHNLELDWTSSGSAISTYGLRTRFSQLGMRPYHGIPGFVGLTGNIEATQSGGLVNFAASNTQVEARDILRWPLPFDRLSGRADWTLDKGKLDVKVANLELSSPHLSGAINANYRYTGKGAGTLDLNGKFSRADGRYAQYYYPLTLSRDTLHWLDTSILGGRGENVSVTVRGNLDEFPWADNKKGLFEISADISDGTLEYGEDWPRLEGVKLGLLFRGSRMELNARQGHLFGNQITKAKAVIPVLDAEHPVLELTGELNSPAGEVIRYLNSSPILNEIDRFTESLHASGNGKLAIGLRIPLDNGGLGTRVKGSYVVVNGKLDDSQGEVPHLENVNGRLDFTESSLQGQNITARAFGSPAQFSIDSKGGQVRVLAQGRMDAPAIRQIVDLPLIGHLQGSADWNADVQVRNKQSDIVVKSSLVGIASNLPAPLGKSASDTLPLTVEILSGEAHQDTLSVLLGKVASARFLRTASNGAMAIDRGEIVFGGDAAIPAQRGIAVRGSLANVDMDQWQAVLDSSKDATASAGNAEDDMVISGVNLDIGALDVFGRRINTLKLDAKPVSNGWRAVMQSQEVTGEALWMRGGNGKIVARLKSLVSPASAPPKMTVPQEQNQQKEIQYPAIDLIAENFEIKQKKLGRLELIATQQNIDWNIDKLVISNPDSTLTVNGVWSNWKRRPHTRLTLAWNIQDIGKTLDRFGYPGTVKGGTADLGGNLRWPGSPHEFTVAGLDGKLKLDARSGQFLKIQPGVGRLLGVLSLQSLPRRLTLDFRDLFSAGFAFDDISANAVIDNGIMRSNDFKMDGPAAKVAIKGETDLARETQNLNIKVTPSISDSLSVAAFAGGPAVGVAALVAQKLLNDPLNKLVAYEYDMAGTWDDPQEVKSKTTPLQAPSPTPGPPGR